jgi:integrase
MTKRRDKGSGAVYRDDDRGGWKGRVTIDGKQYVRRGKTRAEVVDRLNELRRQDAAGDLSRDQTITVAQIVTRYVERTVPNRKAGRLAPRTVARYRWLAQTIVDELGKRRAAQLTTAHVEQMLDRLAGRGLSRDSLTKVLSLLRSALTESVRRREVAHNVAAAAELPGTIRANVPRRSLTPDAARRLLDELTDEPNGAMFALMLTAALRPGEAMGLYWDDIDGHLVNVTRGLQLDAAGRAEVVDDLKTAKARRTVEVPDRVAQMLERHRRDQIAQRLAATTWVDDRLVFASSVGTPLDPKRVRTQLAALCRRVGVSVDSPGGERPPTPNELRHTATSLLSDAGVPNEELADLLGHTTTQMVDRYYRHRLRPTVAVARTVDWATAQ